MNHPVFQTELKRVKQYFAKIDAVENPIEKPTAKLDTEAATRMIKNGLVRSLLSGSLSLLSLC